MHPDCRPDLEGDDPIRALDPEVARRNGRLLLWGFVLALAAILIGLAF